MAKKTIFGPVGAMVKTVVDGIFVVSAFANSMPTENKNNSCFQVVILERRVIKRRSFSWLNK